MCQQKHKLEQLKKKRTISKADILSLAEAQAEDYISHTKEHGSLIRRVENIEKDVGEIKSDISEIKGQMSVIMEYIKSPADSERIKGHLLDYLAAMFKKPIFWIVVIIIALAGRNLVEVITSLFPHLIGA